MLLAGDEMGRTQQGNNNAYCHDDETTWLDWRPIWPEDRALGDFARYLIALRRRHRVFSRPRFFRGEPLHHPLDARTVQTPVPIEACAEELARGAGGVFVDFHGPFGTDKWMTLQGNLRRSLGAIASVKHEVFLIDDSAFIRCDVAAIETRCDFLIERRVGQQIACKLFDRELIERFVAIE